MAIFKLRAMNPMVQGDEKVFLYDNMNSTISTEDGQVLSVDGAEQKQFNQAAVVSESAPGKKSRNIKRLKIQLGLSCNYECTYCNQRFVPHADETNPESVEPFLAQLPSWFDGGPKGDGTDVVLEFWGGEPFVYWKTLKPLAERLHEMYPSIQFTLITNGSLLTYDKNEWLEAHGFQVGMSHDGPGYHVRGEDPLDNPEQKAIILDLWSRLGASGRMSFNAMLNKDNPSRAAVEQFFQDSLGFVPAIGEGTFIDPYDEGGSSTCFDDVASHYKFRNDALVDLRNGKAQNFTTINYKIKDFIDSIAYKRPASAVGQKCGMDRSDNIAVDLNGNVLTCQNTSPVSVGPNGQSHLIGHVSNLDAVEMKTSSHWSTREECPKCPVVQICKGSCMFLHGPLWELGCDAAFSDNIAIFSAAFEAITGYLPYYIDGPQREDRKDVYGLVNGVPNVKIKKPFPIKVVAA